MPQVKEEMEKPETEGGGPEKLGGHRIPEGLYYISFRLWPFLLSQSSRVFLLLFPNPSVY